MSSRVVITLSIGGRQPPKGGAMSSFVFTVIEQSRDHPEEADSVNDEMYRVLEEYLRHQLDMGCYVESTASAVRSDFRGLIRFLESRGVAPTISAFTVRHVGTYLATQRQSGKGFRPATLRRWCKSFRAFGKWARDWGYLERNPMDAIKPEFGPVGRREFMFAEAGDAYRFLTVPIQTRLPVGVDQVLRRLLLFGGLRRNEVLKLKRRHVDLDNQQLLIYDSKASRRKGLPDNFDRAIPLVEPLIQALAELQALHAFQPDDPVVFRKLGRPLSGESFYGAFGAVTAKLALPKDVVPHCLRHNLASQMAALGATSADIALLLGHRSAADGSSRPTATDGYITSSLKRVRGFLDEYARLVLSCEGTPQTAGSGQYRSGVELLDHRVTDQDQGGSQMEEEAGQLRRGAIPKDDASLGELVSLLKTLLSGATAHLGGQTSDRRSSEALPPPLTFPEARLPRFGGGLLPGAQTVPGRYFCGEPTDAGWNVAVVRRGDGHNPGQATDRVARYVNYAAGVLRRCGQALTALYVMPSPDSRTDTHVAPVFEELLADVNSGRIRRIYAPTWMDVTVAEREWDDLMLACERGRVGVFILGPYSVQSCDW